MANARKAYLNPNNPDQIAIEANVANGKFFVYDSEANGFYSKDGSREGGIEENWLPYTTPELPAPEPEPEPESPEEV